MSASNNTITPAGWRINDWCRAIGVSRPTFYNLSGNLQPQKVKVGRSVLITEGPTEYLRRIAKQQRDAS